MNNQELVDTITESITGEVGYEKSVTTRPKQWSDEYTEGFIDGLSRAVELINETRGLL